MEGETYNPPYRLFNIPESIATTRWLILESILSGQDKADNSKNTETRDCLLAHSEGIESEYQTKSTRYVERVIESLARSVYPCLIKTGVQDTGRKSVTNEPSATCG
jgi:hypothetical protein